MSTKIKLDYLQSDVEKFKDEKFYEEAASKVDSLRQAMREFDTYYLCAECRPLFQIRRNELDELLLCSLNLASLANFNESLTL